MRLRMLLPRAYLVGSPPPHGSIDVPLGVLFLDRLALVEGLAAAGNEQLDLGDPFLEIDRDGDQGHSLLAGLISQLGNLAAVKQELARSLGNVVHPVGLEILGDVAAVEPDLAAVDVGISVFQVRLAIAQALDLGAGQNEPRLDLLEELIVVARAPVARDDLDCRIVGFPRRFRFAGVLLGHFKPSDGLANAPAGAAGPASLNE